MKQIQDRMFIIEHVLLIFNNHPSWVFKPKDLKVKINCVRKQHKLQPIGKKYVKSVIKVLHKEGLISLRVKNTYCLMRLL